MNSSIDSARKEPYIPSGEQEVRVPAQMDMKCFIEQYGRPRNCITKIIGTIKLDDLHNLAKDVICELSLIIGEQGEIYIAEQNTTTKSVYDIANEYKIKPLSTIQLLPSIESINPQFYEVNLMNSKFNNVLIITQDKILSIDFDLHKAHRIKRRGIDIPLLLEKGWVMEEELVGFTEDAVAVLRGVLKTLSSNIDTYISLKNLVTNAQTISGIEDCLEDSLLSTQGLAIAFLQAYKMVDPDTFMVQTSDLNLAENNEHLIGVSSANLQIALYRLTKNLNIKHLSGICARLDLALEVAIKQSDVILANCCKFEKIVNTYNSYKKIPMEDLEVLSGTMHEPLGKNLFKLEIPAGYNKTRHSIFTEMKLKEALLEKDANGNWMHIKEVSARDFIESIQ